MSRPPCLLHHGDSRLAPLAVHLTEDETPRAQPLNSAKLPKLSSMRDSSACLSSTLAQRAFSASNEANDAVTSERVARVDSSGGGSSVGRGAIWLPREGTWEKGQCVGPQGVSYPLS